MSRDKSVCIIGGGFYGVVIALYLNRIYKIKNISIFEQESKLLSRSSGINQARIHGGYHYPRSFLTAYRSRKNYDRFCDDWSNCIFRDFRKYYAISKRNSKVNNTQFRRFCKNINKPVYVCEPEIKKLFNKNSISEVYKVDEYAFNSNILRDWALEELKSSEIKIFLNTEVKDIQNINKEILVLSKNSDGEINNNIFSIVFNCTYSGLNQFDNEDFYKEPIKHELAEIALIDVPSEIKDIGITVMDGPFFSTMPFPPERCHSFTHVRYTPHFNWIDSAGKSPYNILRKNPIKSRFEWMKRDASRYLPIMSKSKYIKSIYEIKTTILKNESDDGRPILFRESTKIPRMYSVLGGKIDNIYDILEYIEKLEI